MSTASAPSLPMVNHVHDEDIPWVDSADTELKVLRVAADSGIWIVRSRLQPGVKTETHKHTGDVHGYTLQGRWHYEEYKVDYTAGTYIYEPAGSVHTLIVNADNTEPMDAVFIVQGAVHYLEPDGSVKQIVDGPSMLESYYASCEERGLPRPDGILMR